MDSISRALTLQSGASVTLHAWSYRVFSANFLDFRHLLSAFRIMAGGEAEAPQQMLLDRVLLASLPDQADRDAVQVADLPEVLDAVFDLNRLEDVAAKPLSLYLRLLQAENGILETQPPQAVTSPN